MDANPRFGVGQRTRGTLTSFALVVTWSSGFIGAELGARAGAEPATLLAWRFLLLACLLVPAAAVRGVLVGSWEAWRRQAILALFCQVGYLYLIFEGVAHGVHGGTAALIAALQPVLVATVAGRILGEPISVLMWAGMALGFAGVFIVVAGDLSASGVDWWTYLIPTAGMLCLAAGTVLTRRLAPTENLLQTITMQSVVTAFVFLAVALVSGSAAPPAQRDFWTAVLWLIVLPSLGGYVMYVLVTRTSGATVVSTLLYLTPPTTMLWAFVMFGHSVTAAGLFGLVVSAIGVLLVLLGRRRAPDELTLSTEVEATCQ